VGVITARRSPSTRGMGPAVAVVTLAGLVGLGTIAVGPLIVLPILGLLGLAFIVARPEYGIAMFLSTFLMTYPEALQGSGFLTINNILGGVFLVLLTYKVYRDEDWWFLWRPELHLLAFIVVIYWLSAQINGPDPQQLSLLGVVEHTAGNFRTFVNRVLFTLFFINFIRAPEHVRMIYMLAIAFMVVSALTGIYGVLSGGGLYGYRASTEAAVISSAFNPNRLAMFAILAIGGLWYFMQSLRRPVLRILIIPTLVVLALTVFMTASRSGLLGLGVAIAAILVDQRVSLNTIFTFALGGVLLLLAVIQFVPERSRERLTTLPGTEAAETGEGSGSLERRQYTWQIAWELARENPFLGVGMGNWEVARFLKDPTQSTAAPHSSYLLALVEGGVFCLGAFLLMLWQTWRNLRVCDAHMRDPTFPLADLLWIVKSCEVSFVVLIFFSIFADLWQLVILFWLVGLGIVMRRLVEQTVFEQSLAV
jgi:O-antigen ligase